MSASDLRSPAAVFLGQLIQSSVGACAMLAIFSSIPEKLIVNWESDFSWWFLIVLSGLSFSIFAAGLVFYYEWRRRRSGNKEINPRNVSKGANKINFDLLQAQMEVLVSNIWRNVITGFF